MARIRLTEHSTSVSNVIITGYHQLSDGAKLTYMVLESYDWPDETGLSKGKVWPSVETIATLRGKGRRTIEAHLNELVAIGLIEIESGKETGQCNCYNINEPSQAEVDGYQQRLAIIVDKPQGVRRNLRRGYAETCVGGTQKLAYKELNTRNKTKELKSNTDSTRIAHDTYAHEDKEPYPINSGITQEPSLDGYERTQPDDEENQDYETDYHQSQDQPDYQSLDREKETPPFRPPPLKTDEELTEPPATGLSLKDIIAWQKQQKQKQVKPPANQPTSPPVTPPVKPPTANQAKPVELPAGRQPTKPPAQAIVYIARLMNDFSRELKDEQHSLSNRSQTIKLFEQSGLSQDEFVSVLYTAKDRTRWASEAGKAKGGNKGAYFFEVVRDLLGQGKAGSQAVARTG